MKKIQRFQSEILDSMILPKVQLEDEREVAPSRKWLGGDTEFVSLKEAVLRLDWNRLPSLRAVRG